MCILFLPEEKTVLEMLMSLLTLLLAKTGDYYGLFLNHGCVRTGSTPEETLTHGKVPPRGRRLPWV